MTLALSVTIYSAPAHARTHSSSHARAGANTPAVSQRSHGAPRQRTVYPKQRLLQDTNKILRQILTLKTLEEEVEGRGKGADGNG